MIFNKVQPPPPPDGTAISSAVGVLTFLLVMSTVTQEVCKQQALSRFPVSQFQPLLYALFNVLSILTSVIVFRELDGEDWFGWLWFLVFFSAGMTVIWFGSRRLPTDIQQQPIKRL